MLNASAENLSTTIRNLYLESLGISEQTLNTPGEVSLIIAVDIHRELTSCSAELAITSLISNKPQWNNCFIKFLKLQKFEVRNTSEKKRENPSEIEKKLIKMRCCVTPCGQTDVGSSQKYFLPFRVLLNVGIDPNFPQKSVFFFLGFIQTEISLSGENIFSSATLSAIIWPIRSN